MCGSFQLYIWWLNLKQTLSFISTLQNKLVWTLTEDIIIQPEPEKQEKSQISEKKFWSLTDFEWIFLMRQILKQNFYKASNFDLNF